MNADDAKYIKRMKKIKVLGIMPKRMKHIKAGAPVPPRMDYAANVTAAALHPGKQYFRVSEIIPREGGAKSFILVPDTEKGTVSPAVFEPGHYLNFELKIGDSTTTRNFSICCPASWASQGKYMITVKPSENGFAGNWVCENWEVGTEVVTSGPLGEFRYNRLRDSRNIVAVCGGSGITPIYSMAASISEGTMDADLTIIYCSNSAEDAMLNGELQRIAGECEKVKLLNLFGEPVTAEFIKANAPESDYSLFVCGPAGMMKHMESQIPLLSIPRRRVRKKTYGVTDPAVEEGWNPELSGKVFELTVRMRDSEYKIPCRADETILVAMERAGLKPPSHCRSGECGWCRSKLNHGEIFMPERTDKRRMADHEYGYIHPCCTFPASNVTISVMCE